MQWKSEFRFFLWFTAMFRVMRHRGMGPMALSSNVITCVRSVSVLWSWQVSSIGSRVLPCIMFSFFDITTSGYGDYWPWGGVAGLV